LLSIRLDTSATPSRSKANYYDSDSLDEVFGHDRVDRYWDETEGQGVLERGTDQNLWHQPRGAEAPQIATPELIESYLGPEVDDVV
jgi:hypothetical protein